MVMHPDRMPAHCCDEVAGHMAGPGRDVTFHSQKVIGDWVVDTVRHAMRYKLGEWKGIMVSQPRYRPTLIDVHQAPRGVHGPQTLLSRCIEEGEVRCGIPASQGLSTWRGGYYHDPFPTLS